MQINLQHWRLKVKCCGWPKSQDQRWVFICVSVCIAACMCSNGIARAEDFWYWHRWIFGLATPLMCFSFFYTILCFYILRFFYIFRCFYNFRWLSAKTIEKCVLSQFSSKNSISQLKLLNFCYFLLPASNQVPPSVSKRIKLQIHCKYKNRVSNFILVTTSKQKCNQWKFKKKTSDKIVSRKFACKTKPPKQGYYCTKTMSMFAHRKIFILNYWFISYNCLIVIGSECKLFAIESILS